MLILTKPYKAFLILFFISLGVVEYGLVNTALAVFLLIGGLILYNWWVRNFKV